MLNRIAVMRHGHPLAAILSLTFASALLQADQTGSESQVRSLLASHSVPLHGGGQERLLTESRNHDLFLLGELHGETEIPSLLQDLWPKLWQQGYRHVAAELSPWAADHLERPANIDTTRIEALWTREQAATVREFAKSGQRVLWGCDMDEGQPERLISDLAALNPTDGTLAQMMRINSHGYHRMQALELFHLAKPELPAHDAFPNGVSLWQSVRDTLQIEALRSDPGTKLAASEARELLMKKLFLAHYQNEPQGKVLLRFGRNHLHRGYDARGVSTLGNFVAEWALAGNKSVFNMGVFAAGGKERLAGKTFDADERQDEPAFALLAALAGTKPTLFDLRPLRPVLQAISVGKRTSMEVNLTYWVNSYDFLLCYPVVSPLEAAQAVCHGACLPRG